MMGNVPLGHRARARCCTRRSSRDCIPRLGCGWICMCFVSCLVVMLQSISSVLIKPLDVYSPTLANSPSTGALPQYSTVTCSCTIPLDSSATRIGVPSKSSFSEIPANSKNVGARSICVVTVLSTRPSGTPGPLIKNGTRISSSKPVDLPGASLC